ncbi:MAG: hypothetical protein A3K19_32820 [Lentisphaerae bacterium RIFOXYB12_FULL_65_16]|nr:MAG: hypothetical protein A3K18_20320 [Lentisphaerae bacterium RIFOXYA12_64_32]OGV84527.1 MAG: hypothetical protein A3K19_32820 [Lentisphaerae bacterium RIFOXYB12_FULL_65_16]
MKPHVIHEDAEAELWAEVGFYEKQVPGLGLDFLSEAEQAFDRIGAAPERWQHARHGTQRVFLRGFPHTVYYRNLPDVVWITAVAPQKRRPFYWRYRLKDAPPIERPG